MSRIEWGIYINPLANHLKVWEPKKHTKEGYTHLHVLKYPSA
jgi:hypothetical protein